MSHSHADRQVALALNRVLNEHGAKTFFDQDVIDPADMLPDRIHQGIEWCGLFLLLWSEGASRSRWVDNEWNDAWDLRKKILPYLLDQTPLPEAMGNLVWIDSSDRKLANANLLKAVFGRTFAPEGVELFPGQWYATLSTQGGSATYDLELRINGQITGSGEIDQSSGYFGMLHNLLQQEGVMNAFASRITLSGEWSYDRDSELLILDVESRMMGQTAHRKVSVRVSGRCTETISLYGQDSEGAKWELTRASDILNKYDI